MLLLLGQYCSSERNIVEDAIRSCSDQLTNKKQKCIISFLEAEENLNVVPTSNPRLEALNFLQNMSKSSHNTIKRPCFAFVCQGESNWEAMCVALATTLRVARPVAEIFAGVPASRAPLSRTTLRTLAALNVHVQPSGNPLEKWDETYLVGNKIGVLIQASANGCSERASHIVLLDTDIIAVSSSSKDSRLDEMFDNSIHVPVAGHADASRAAKWNALYGVLNLKAPPSSSSTEVTSLCSKEKMPLYYSSGMIIMPRESQLGTIWMLTARAMAQDMTLGTWTWKDSGRPQLMFLLDQYSLIVALESLRVKHGIEHVAMSDNSVHCVLNCHMTKIAKTNAFDTSTFVHYQQFSNLCHVGSSFQSVVLRDANNYLRSVFAPVRIRLECDDRDVIVLDKLLKKEDDFSKMYLDETSVTRTQYFAAVSDDQLVMFDQYRETPQECATRFCSSLSEEEEEEDGEGEESIINSCVGEVESFLAQLSL